MSARTSRTTNLRRSAVAAGILAAALTVGTVAPAMAVSGAPGTVSDAPSGRSTENLPLFEGTTDDPNTTVDIVIGGDADITDQVTSDDNGVWTWESSGFDQGHYTYAISIAGIPAAPGSFVVDTDAPVVSIGDAPAAESTAPSATFTWSAVDDDTDLTYHWSFDDGPEQTGTSTTATFTGLTNGPHWLQVWAEDSLHNISDRYDAEYDFDVALPTPAGPDVSFTSTPAASTTSTSAHFTLNAPAGTEVEYVLDLPEGAQMADPVAASTDFTLTGLSVGHHKIQVGSSLDGGFTLLTYEWDVTAAGAPAPAAAPQVLAPDAIPAAMINRGIKSGATGPSVSLIQSIVGTPADGKFGAKTSAAVKAFQRAHGLLADGIVGPRTWAAMVDVANGGSGVGPITRASIPAAQIARGIKPGSSGQAVSVIQRALGTPATGTFNAATKAAVKAFQSSHGLKVDGIVGRLTWAALTKR
jgi:peptidoglycan hydrolase-like protein with peptidoglycan-binding domain